MPGGNAGGGGGGGGLNIAGSTGGGGGSAEAAAYYPAGGGGGGAGGSGYADVGFAASTGGTGGAGGGNSTGTAATGTGGTGGTADTTATWNGGGVLLVYANSLTTSGTGTITSRGFSGGTYAGGGSGGSILLNANTMTLAPGSINVAGGGGGNAGGLGRVRLSFNTLDTGSGAITYPNPTGVATAMNTASTPDFSSGALPLYTVESGKVTSLSYDTGTMQPAYTQATPTTTGTGSGSSVGFFYSSSPDNVNWSPWTATITAVPAQRYFRWQAVITIGTGQPGSPQIMGVKITYDY